MRNFSRKAISLVLVSLLIMGNFAFAKTSNADWGDLLGDFGLAGYAQNYGNNYNYNQYDYNSTDGRSDGDIEITKEVKEIGRDDNYHDRIRVPSGALVEVWIEVRNTSSRHSANVVVRDEMSGSIAYKQGSLLVNGRSSQPGLTSGGLPIVIPPQGKADLIYQMNVCGGTDYAMRASAYAAGIGSATDAVIIGTENFNVPYVYDETYTCMSQYQQTSPYVPQYDNYYYNAPSYGTPYYNYTPNYNYTPYSNPFGDWYGVQNFDATNPADPFGDWYGVQNDPTSNPFGDWYGVQNFNSQYDAGGYSVNQPRPTTYTGYTQYSGVSTAPVPQPRPQPRPTGKTGTQTYYVAPTTGANKIAPFMFAVALTLGFLAFRKRKLLFN